MEKIGQGKEATVYKDGNYVVKVFHNERKTSTPMMSVEGFNKIKELDLRVFNKPLAIEEENGKITRLVEDYVEDEEFNKEAIINCLDDIKHDIKLLSDNGFRIDDINYNYMINNGKIRFIDYSSYNYINTDKDFLKNMFYKKNLELMNNFLIGSLMFDAYRKGSEYEMKKTFMANEYRNNNCRDIFFGDIVDKDEYLNSRSR